MSVFLEKRAVKTMRSVWSSGGPKGVGGGVVPKGACWVIARESPGETILGWSGDFLQDYFSG